LTQENLVELGKELQRRQESSVDRSKYMATLKELFDITKQFDPDVFQNSFTLLKTRSDIKVAVHELIAHIRIYRQVYVEKNVKIAKLRAELQQVSEDLQFEESENSRHIVCLNARDDELLNYQSLASLDSAIIFDLNRSRMLLALGYIFQAGVLFLLFRVYL
jgi:hypothetical protein